jgi:NMD protein affecting ribosome stability and mRNA decay
MDPDLKWDIPNRRFLCEICVEWFSFDDCYVDPEGTKWSMCRSCGEEEARNEWLMKRAFRIAADRLSAEYPLGTLPEGDTEKGLSLALDWLRAHGA